MSAAYLLDVNVLIAGAWPPHGHHVKTQEWLTRHAHRGWATCPLTQLGFVRVLSLPHFAQHPIVPGDALALLNNNLGFDGHEFWADDLTFAEALAYFAPQVSGAQQTTDAYLLGLAMHRKGKLVTFDRGILALAGDHAGAREALVLI